MAPIESTPLAHLGERLPGGFRIPADGRLELDTVVPRAVLLDRRRRRAVQQVVDTLANLWAWR